MSLYTFSLVMAVYNVEPFLSEAIDSIIAQDIGFEQIQLILVNDGSRDSSGKICDAYQQQYPDNIFVVHKENGGVSTARNAGLELAQGQYINFIDSDDKLSPSTLRLVKEFFDTHADHTDAVAIPLVFFDARTGGHPLNAKFNQGSRVIDLRKEWKYPQLSFSCTFVKRQCMEGLRFDPHLAYAEDAQLVQKILLHKQTLGVVAEACYHYRKRSTGEASAIQSSGKNLAWYFPYLTYFTEHIVAHCMDTLGEIPLFIQNTLMYDLQWRFRQTHIPADLFTAEEAEAYRCKLFALLAHIDDQVILNQASLTLEQKIFLLQRKHPDCKPAPLFHHSNKKHLLSFNGSILCDYESFLLKINFLRVEPEYAEIEGVYTVPNVITDLPRLSVLCNGEPIAAQNNGYDETLFCVDIPIAVCKGFRVHIPLCSPENMLSFLLDFGAFEAVPDRIIYGTHAPITHKLKYSYFYSNGYLVKPLPAGLYIDRCRAKNILKAECKLLAEVCNPDAPVKQVFFYRLLARLLRPLCPKNIWLIMDKADRADDNGEAFFLYCRKHRREANCCPVFAVSKDSPDYKRMKQYGPVIPYLSLRHKLCHLLATHTISAYSHDEVTTPFLFLSHYFCDLLQWNKIVFLQHGIIKDDVSPFLNRNHKNYSLFVTSAKPEYDSLLEYNYGYSDRQVILTGLPRYDRLYNNDQKKITVMPTWRRSLFGAYDPTLSRWTLLPSFESTLFYRFYSDLLNDPSLHAAAKKYGYSLQFLVHPTLFPYLDRFRFDPNVTVLGADAVYRDVFAESSLIVTDYSSVAFDMAYLRKCVLYTHFDSNHYAEGYFNYERDGFGEVEYTLEDTIRRMIAYMERGCSLEDTYRQRIDNFFAFDDRCNCQRVFREIQALDAGK